MLLTFQNRFEQPIVDRIKIHSFRIDQHDRWKTGNSIQFYVNARTKQMRKFREDGECKGIQPVEIKGIHSTQGFFIRVFIGEGLSITCTEQFAKNDGFASAEDMRQCLVAMHPDDHTLKGKVIHWTDFKY